MRHNGDDCLMMVRAGASRSDSVHRPSAPWGWRIGYTGALFKGE